MLTSANAPPKAPIAFSGSPIDRADNIRVDPEALAAQMNWRARVLLLDGLLPQIDDTGGLVWGTLADVGEETELVFLGLLDGKACFAPVPENRLCRASHAARVAGHAIARPG